MPIKLRTLAWLLVLLWVVPGLAFGERKGRLVGKVLDPDGKGIPGVTVIVTSPDVKGFKDAETTDKKGVFTVDFTTIDVKYHYRFDKAGFQSMETEQLWGVEGSGHFEWTMKPGESATVTEPGAAPPASTSPEAITAYNAGVVAAKVKDNATAETKFKESVTHDPNLKQAWAQLATVQVELGHNKEAAEASEKAIALGYADEALFLARWKAYKNLKDDVKAAEALKDLDKFGRRTEEAKKFHNEGVALVKAGDNAGAFAKFQEALNVDPNLKPSLLGLATAGLKIGKNSEALDAAAAILKDDPKNEKAIRIRYNAALALGDKAKLSEALLTLAPIEPKVARVGLWNLATEAYGANDWKLAASGYTKVIELDPTYAPAYYWLGLIEVGNGAPAAAKVHLSKFVELAPNDPEAESVREMLRHLK